MMQVISSHSKKGSNLYWVFFLILVGVFPWLIRLSLLGDVSFGYDTGIYRRNIPIYAEAGIFHSLPPFSFMSITTLLSYFGLSVDGILFGGYMSLIAITILSIFYYFRQKYQSSVAGIITILFTLSLPFITFVHFFYYRNLFAVAGTFITLSLYKKTYWYFLPFVLVLYIHPIIGFILGAAIGCVFLKKKSFRDVLLLTGISASIFFLNSKELGGYIADLYIAQDRYINEFTGQYVSFPELVKQLIPVLPFAVYSLFFLRQHIPRVLRYMFMITLIWSLFQLPFYRRLYLFIDVVILIHAALAIVSLWKKTHLFTNLLISTTLLLLLFTGWSRIIFQPPLLSLSEVLTINQAAADVSSNTGFLAYTSAEAPWLYGYASSVPLIAPGLFDDNLWSYQQWQQFWTSADPNEQIHLLSLYRFDNICIFGQKNRQAALSASFSENTAIRYWEHGFWCFRNAPASSTTP